ncbi:MAG: hypothetical protein WB983_03580, partial [Terriglobales bacterium]
HLVSSFDTLVRAGETCRLRLYLLQLLVLGLGLLQDGNVGVSVSPQGEEVFLGGKRPDTGGISPGRILCLERICTRHSQMSQRSGPAVPDDSAVVDDLLKLRDRFLALPRRRVRLAANVGGIEAGEVYDKENLAVLDGRYGRLQARNRGSDSFG